MDPRNFLDEVNVFQFLDQYGRPTGKKITGMVYFRIYRYGNDANTSGAYSLTWS